MLKMTALMVALAVATGCSRTDVDAANAAAREYAHHFEGITSIDCASTDTDGDGYVSCTLFRGSSEPLQVQCGSERLCIWNCARGCKYVPSVKVMGSPTLR